MTSEEIDIDLPNQVRVAKCPLCNGNVFLCAVDYLNANNAKHFDKLKQKDGCIIQHISIRQAREQDLCFNLNKCGGKPAKQMLAETGKLKI